MQDDEHAIFPVDSQSLYFGGYHRPMDRDKRLGGVDGPASLESRVGRIGTSK
jgi:hypothetical protein